MTLPILLFLIGSWLVVGSLTAAAWLADLNRIFHRDKKPDGYVASFSLLGFVLLCSYLMICWGIEIKPFTSFRFR